MFDYGSIIFVDEFDDMCRSGQPLGETGAHSKKLAKPDLFAVR